MMMLPAKRSGYLARPINMLIDWCWKNYIVNSPDIVRDEMPGGVALRFARREMELDQYPFVSWATFGCTFDGAVVKIWNPRARRYGDAIYAGPNTEVELSDGDNQRIVWTWNPTDGLLIQDTAQVNDPSDDSTTIRGIVCIVNCTNGKARIADGDIVGATDQLGHLLTLPLFAVATA